MASGSRLDACLQPWSALEKEGRLRRAYLVARPLAALDRALHYLEDVELNTDAGVDRRQMEHLLCRYARTAVKSLDFWTW